MYSVDIYSRVGERQVWAVSDIRQQGRNADFRCACTIERATRRKRSFNSSVVTMSPERFNIKYTVFYPLGGESPVVFERKGAQKILRRVQKRDKSKRRGNYV
jgi:hypothetical protein